MKTNSNNLAHNLRKLNFESTQIKIILNSEHLTDFAIRHLNATGFTQDQIAKMISKKINFCKAPSNIKPNKKEVYNKQLEEYGLSLKQIKILLSLKSRDLEKYEKIETATKNIYHDPSKDEASKKEQIKLIFMQELRGQRKSDIKYNTYNLQQILAYVAEYPGVTIKNILNVIDIKEKAARRNINNLIEKKLVYQNGTNSSGAYTYRATVEGVIKNRNDVGSFLYRDKEEDTSNITHYKNDLPLQTTSFEIFKKTKIIDKKLRSLGIFGCRVREFIEKNSLDYLDNLYNFVCHNQKIQNKGAYIYAILTKRSPHRRLQQFIEQKILPLGTEIAEVYRKQCREFQFTLKESLHIGYALVKKSKKMQITIPDIHTTIGYILKRICGIRNEQKPTQKLPQPPENYRKYTRKNIKFARIKNIMMEQQRKAERFLEAVMQC